MKKSKQKFQLIVAASGAVLFIALMVVLAITLSGGNAQPKKTQGGGPLTGPVGVLHSGTIPSSGHFDGSYLAFAFPKGASNLESYATAANTEAASFVVDGVHAQVSTEAAPPGINLSEIAATAGAAKPITLAFGRGYVVDAHSSSGNAVVLMFYRTGRFVFVQISGAGGGVSADLALAKQLQASLKVTPRVATLSTVTG